MIFPTLHLKIERWKFNKDYGVYVSTLGNFKDRHKRRLPVRINQNGYCNIQTEQGYKLAHRLVMLTWKPIPDAENLTVDHLNHNKRDNSLANLEWVTAKENKIRAARDSISEKKPKPKSAATLRAERFLGFEVCGQFCKTAEEAYNIATTIGTYKGQKATFLEGCKNLANGSNAKMIKQFGKNNNKTYVKGVLRDNV